MSIFVQQKGGSLSETATQTTAAFTTTPTVGNVMVICVCEGGAATWESVSATGWTVLAQAHDTTSGNGAAVLYRVVQSGDTGAVTLNITNGQNMNDAAYVIFELSGIDTTTPINGYSTKNNTGSSVTSLSASVTPTKSGTIAVAGWSDNNPGGTSTITSGFTSYEYSGNVGNCNAWQAYNATAQGTGAVTFTFTRSNAFYGGLVLLLLNPVPPSPPYSTQTKLGTTQTSSSGVYSASFTTTPFDNTPTVGNQMFLCIRVGGTSYSVVQPATPSGWTYVATDPNGGSYDTDRLFIYTKTVTSGDTGAVTFTVSESAGADQFHFQSFIYEFVGANTTTPINKVASWAFGASTPTVTPTVVGTRALAFALPQGNGSTTASGWTQDATNSYPGPSIAHMNALTTDTTTAISTGISATYGGVLLLVAPAPTTQSYTENRSDTFNQSTSLTQNVGKTNNASDAFSISSTEIQNVGRLNNASDVFTFLQSLAQQSISTLGVAQTIQFVESKKANVSQSTSLSDQDANFSDSTSSTRASHYSVADGLVISPNQAPTPDTLVNWTTFGPFTKGSGDFEYVGTGSNISSNGGAYSTAIAVTPGQVYTTSWLVDPTQVTHGAMDFFIESPDGSTIYKDVGLSGYVAGGPKQRYAASPSWTCPAGVTSVRIRFMCWNGQSGGFIVANGQKLTLAQPMLRTDGVSSPYIGAEFPSSVGNNIAAHTSASDVFSNGNTVAQNIIRMAVSNDTFSHGDGTSVKAVYINNESGVFTLSSVPTQQAVQTTGASDSFTFAESYTSMRFISVSDTFAMASAVKQLQTVTTNKSDSFTLEAVLKAYRDLTNSLSDAFTFTSSEEEGKFLKATPSDTAVVVFSEALNILSGVEVKAYDELYFSSNPSINTALIRPVSDTFSFEDYARIQFAYKALMNAGFTFVESSIIVDIILQYLKLTVKAPIYGDMTFASPMVKTLPLTAPLYGSLILPSLLQSRNI